MKTFDDLVFTAHPVCPGLRARLDFPNGFGISVVRFRMALRPDRYGSYTCNESEWECAVFHGGELCYDSGITDDVIGHLTATGVSTLMLAIQCLPPRDLVSPRNLPGVVRREKFRATE